MHLYFAVTSLVVLSVWADIQMHRETAGTWHRPPFLELIR